MAVFARALVAYLHYLALALGLGGLFVRGVQLRRLRTTPGDAGALAALFRADNAWGVAALLWIATGLVRVFAGLEKTSDFYLRNGFFYLKMTLFLLVFLLEIRPMVTFIKWRMALRKGGSPTSAARLDPLVRLNDLELALVVLIPFVATLMARGAWLF
jgi:putative membrane protein